MDLLQQAILDGNQLRETAMASAKAAVLETFQPRIQRLVSQKLAEEDEDENLDMDDLGAGDDIQLPVDGDELQSTGDETIDVNIPVEEPVDGVDDLTDDALDGESGDMEEDLQTFLASLSEEDFSTDDSEEDTELSLEGLSDDTILEIDDIDVAMSLPNNSKNEVKKLRAENKQLRSALLTLRTAVNEVKLLNTKLNYVSKLNDRFKLDSNRQMKLLEAFDNATNLREAKLVFDTYASIYGKQTASPQITKESRQSASKSVAVIKESVVPTKIDANIDRLQRLANIKNLHD